MTTMRVSIETAKLLKEKGYDVPCNHVYTNRDRLIVLNHEEGNFDGTDNIVAPIIHEVAVWLREVKRIHVAALPVNLSQQWRMLLYIDTIPPQKQRIPDTPHDFSTYHQALEAGIIHALKNYL